MSKKTIFNILDEYKDSRLKFVQQIAQLSENEQNVLPLCSGGIMSLLKPLLMDSVQKIQTSAALAISRLSRYSPEIAETVIHNDIITQLIYSLSNQNRFFKKAACCVLQSVAKHNTQLAESVVDCGVLIPLVSTLNDFDTKVKESAAWTLCHIAKHSSELAKKVVETNAIEGLINCLQDKEINLKVKAAQTLAMIAKHNEKLADQIASVGLALITSYLEHKDSGLRRNICLLLGNIGMHSIDLANQVRETLIEPDLLLSCLIDTDNAVKQNASYCILQLVNKSPELSKFVVDEGGLGVIVNFVAHSQGNTRLNAILALGKIAHHEDTMAEGIINCNALSYLKDALEMEPSQRIKGAIIETIGEIGQHTPKQSNRIAGNKILAQMLSIYREEMASDDLKLQIKIAMKKIISNCDELENLVDLIEMRHLPDKILFYIVLQLDKHAKKNEYFLKSFGRTGLKTLVEIKSKYPEEVIDEIDKFLSNNYESKLIDAICPDRKLKKKKELIDGIY